MIAPDIETGIAALRALIDGARVVLPFTGAGISTECGIPDFRSPGGLWTKNHPIPFDEFLANQDMRNEAWRRRFAMRKRSTDFPLLVGGTPDAAGARFASREAGIFIPSGSGPGRRSSSE